MTYNLKHTLFLSLQVACLVIVLLSFCCNFAAEINKTSKLKVLNTTQTHIILIKKGIKYEKD